MVGFVPINNCFYICVFLISSDEAKSVVEDKLSEVASGLISAYDSGELGQALAEGHDGWKKWVKSFGKTHKRKVSVDEGDCGLILLPAESRAVLGLFQRFGASKLILILN